MGISDWRAKRHMKRPVRGVFRITGVYDAPTRSSPSGIRITGVITAPGIQATTAEHQAEDRGQLAGIQSLPVLVDLTDPARSVVLWDEVRPGFSLDQEMPTVNPAPGYQFGPHTSVSSTVVTIGPDGQSRTVPMSPETAARVESALSAVFGQAGGPGLGQAVGQAFGRAAGQASWADQEAPGVAPHGGFRPAEAAQFLAGGAGEQADAVVVAAQEVAPPGFAAPGGTVDLTLRITRADGSGYTTPTRVSFSTPERRSVVATPGTRLRVRIDPHVPSRVAIDTAGLF